MKRKDSFVAAFQGSDLGGVSFTEKNYSSGSCDRCVCAPLLNFRLSKQLPSPSETDALYVQELKELSIEERERVMEEVHGVVNPLVEETDDFVRASLRELEQTVQQIKTKQAYDRAMFLSPARVKDPKFLLMFLRSESFDVKKAARRLIKYYESKLVLWGESRLVKEPITLEDLSPDDLEALEAGSLQPLGVSDRSGRPISFMIQKNIRYKHWSNQVSGFQNNRNRRLRGIRLF